MGTEEEEIGHNEDEEKEEEGEEDMEEEMEEELADCESKLLCSSPPPQLARHLHSEKKL